MRDPTRLGRWGLLLSGLVLVGGWWLGAWGDAPPLYDGLPLSAEPYRYLSSPPGAATTGPPSTVSATLTANPASSGHEFALSTTEAPPQASILASTGDFQPAGHQLVIGIRPVAQAIPVTRGHPDGNVYSVDVTGATMRPGTRLTVALRGTGAPGSPVLCRLEGGRWVGLPTTHVPPVIYSAPSPGPGEFLLVLPPVARPTRPASGGAGGVAVLIAAVLVATAILLGLIRRLRASR